MRESEAIGVYGRSGAGRYLSLLLIAFLAVSAGNAQQMPEQETKPADPFFSNVHPVKAPPVPDTLLLVLGDRLAICGDSITEQKMYSRIIETYLTVCTPELKISTRQYGWSGEQAVGFKDRMASDCLRFMPTVATTCYGMNDYHYQPYSDAVGQAYRNNSVAVIKAFKAAGARVVMGSPGCVGKVAAWVKSATGTVEQHNTSLCELRNIGIDVAKKEDVRFADIFWPMYKAAYDAKKRYGADYEVPGKDGVHPGWAGQVIMAHSFLRAFGLKGDIGVFTVDLAARQATSTQGHTVDKFDGTELTVTSTRYPFCAAGSNNVHSSIRSGMTLVPFNQDLNRLTLIVKGASAASYSVTWGGQSAVYTSNSLAAGVNLAEDFTNNPFMPAFTAVDKAVAAKQEFETRQIKTRFRSQEARTNMAAVVEATEKERKVLADAISAAFVPVTHTIRIQPDNLR